MEIKSAAEILKEHIDRSSDDESDIECLTDAMKEYAAQFIELAAEEAKLSWNNTPHKRGYPWFAWNSTGLEEHGDKCITVDREQILKLKEQIK